MVGRTSGFNAEVAHRNNGDVVPDAVVDEIHKAGGPASFDSWWRHEGGSPGHWFPDDAVDWVEATANDENRGGEGPATMGLSMAKREAGSGSSRDGERTRLVHTLGLLVDSSDSPFE